MAKSKDHIPVILVRQRWGTYIKLLTTLLKFSCFQCEVDNDNAASVGGVWNSAYVMTPNCDLLALPLPVSQSNDNNCAIYQQPFIGCESQSRTGQSHT
jgi:hypothetical protein